MSQLVSVVEALRDGKVQSGDFQVKVYEKSYTEYEDVKLVMVNDQGAKWILATGKGQLFDELQGENLNNLGKACPLTHENRLVLNRYFEYTVPQAFGTKIATMGLGDRLGLASPGHIQTVKDRKVKPILAQQSIRELTLTNRSMTDILDAAAFAVFQEGYTGGYGADGDHIKEEKDIEYALSLGISFLTLDCSDQIDNSVEGLTKDQLRTKFGELSQKQQDYFTKHFLNQTFDVNGISITYDEDLLMKNVLLYGKALDFTEHVYKNFITKAKQDVDFELSIDETETVTSPGAHFFVAEELGRRDVVMTSLAPRFCGEFQKGIDYIGDIEQFEKELSEHAAIAEHFGYKLSIHSGSDKFSVFPIIGKYTKGVLHIKTAGTNWLEAVRVIAQINPSLYRRMHAYALDNVDEALKYYHVTSDFDSIAPLDSKSDNELSTYMDFDPSRQLLHITYGILLTAKDDQGNFLFRDEFFQTLHDHEEEYNQALIKHIGRHVDLLGL